MSESLWNDIDSALKTALTSGMGVDSGLPDELLTSVEITDQWNLQEASLPIAYLYSGEWEPGNTDEFPAQGEQAGSLHLSIDNLYSYQLVLVSSKKATFDLAREAGKKLYSRARNIIRNIETLSSLPASSDSEVFVQLLFERADIEIQGYSGSSFLGGARITFQVYTKV